MDVFPVIILGNRAWLAVFLAVAGCMATRQGLLPPSGHHPPSAVAAAAPTTVAYRTHFIGPVTAGNSAFAQRVAEAFARHPTLRFAATEGPAALELDLTLTNTRNGLVAGLSGLAAGLSVALIPAYARDELALTVEARRNDGLVRRFDYREVVTTVVHVSAAFMANAGEPRVVVEDVVDDLLLHALEDLERGGLLSTGTAVQGRGVDRNTQAGGAGGGSHETPAFR